MATVVSFEFTIVDGKKQKSSVTLFMYSLGGVETIDELHQIAVTALPIVRNIIYGGIISCRIGFEANIASLLASFPTLAIPEEYADVEEGAIFEWGHQATPKSTKQRIPTFDESCLVPGTRTVDLANLQVEAFAAMMIEFIETPVDTYTFCNSKGDDIDYIIGASENFKYRKWRKWSKR